MTHPSHRRVAAGTLKTRYARICSYALLLCSMLLQGPARAQVFNSATSTETTFPAPPLGPMYYLDNNIKYLFTSSVYTTLLYAPPYMSGTASVASWSHDMYVTPSGASAADGGGFSLGLIEPAGSYIGLLAVAMPNAANISAVAMHGNCQENVMVVYAMPCGGDSLDECRPYAQYYYQMYHWVHPSSLTPTGPPVALTTGCSFFDRISIDINHDATKAVVVWGHNNTALFSKAFDFNTGTLTVGPTNIISSKGNLADVAFRQDPVSGTEYLHFAYLSRVIRASCEELYEGDVDLGLSEATFIEGMTTFNALMSGTFSGLTDLNIEPSGISGIVDEAHLVLDAPDVSAAPNWSYTWNERTDNRVYVRTYKDLVSMPTDPSWTVNNGIVGGPAPRFTPGINPSVAYHPTGSQYYVGFAGGPNDYVACQINDAGGLVSMNDYLEIPNSSSPTSGKPLVALSKNSTGDYLYTAFVQEDAMGNFSLVHKGHPWMSPMAWKQPKVLNGTQEADVRIYPNPFTDVLHFEVPEAGQTGLWTLTMTNVLGQSVADMRGAAAEVNNRLQQLAPGLTRGHYMLTIDNGSGKVQHKTIVKQ
ncbi:hypothetical protein D3C71_110170 [compost metagenome]